MKLFSIATMDMVHALPRAYFVAGRIVPSPFSDSYGLVEKGWYVCFNSPIARRGLRAAYVVAWIRHYYGWRSMRFRSLEEA